MCVCVWRVVWCGVSGKFCALTASDAVLTKCFSPFTNFPTVTFLQVVFPIVEEIEWSFVPQSLRGLFEFIQWVERVRAWQDSCPRIISQIALQELHLTFVCRRSIWSLHANGISANRKLKIILPPGRMELISRKSLNCGSHIARFFKSLAWSLKCKTSVISIHVTVCAFPYHISCFLFKEKKNPQHIFAERILRNL